MLFRSNSYTITANVTGAGESGLWTQIMGSAGPVIQSPTTNSTLITGLVNGSYTFRWTITNGACISYDDVTINASEPPVAVNAGTDIDVCGTSSTQFDATPVAGGVWTLYSGPNFPTFSSLTAANATVSNLVMGTYEFIWSNTSSEFCPSTSDIVQVVVVPAANAGSDQSYCEAITAVNLTGNLASIGTWTWVTKPAGAPDPTITTTSQNTAVASGLAPYGNVGVYTFRYTITSGACSTSDEMNVTLYAPPSTAAAGPDQYLCDATTFTMAATPPAFGTGSWSKLFGPDGGAFTDALSATTTFTGAVPGVYVFQWTVANGDCNNADQVRIENYDEPSAAVAGSNIAAVCGTTATMNATDPAVGVGNWTFISKIGDGPTPIITSPILYNTTITNLGPQSDGNSEVYTFEWSVSNGPVCPINSQTMTITVHQTPTPAVAGSDQNLCDDFSTVLDGNTPSPGVGEWTIISKPAGATNPVFSLTDATTPTATATFDNTKYGTYQLRWTTNTTFCNSYDDVNITIYQNPSDPQDVANFEICQFDNLTLTTTAPTVGTGVWTKESGPSVNILNPNSNTTQVIGFVVGTYVFRYTVSNGTCADKYDEVTVTVNPIPSQALAGADQFLCNATSATLAGNDPALGTGTWSVTSGQLGVTFSPNANTYNAVVNGLVPGSPEVYTLRWTVATGGCDSYDELNVTTWATPTTSNAGTSQDLCNTSTFTLNGNSPTVGTGLWTLFSGPNTPSIQSPTSANTNINGTVSGTYIYRWTITNGTVCAPSTDTVTVIVRPPITLSGPTSVTVCDEAQPTLTVTPSGGTGNYNYQWRESVDGCTGPWTPLVGNNPTYQTEILNETRYYTVIVTDASITCDAVTSSCATVTVVADPTISSVTLSRDICQGGSTTFVVDASGGTPSLSYRWQYNNGGTWANAVNNTPSGFTYTGLTGTTLSVTTTNAVTAGAYEYRVLVSASGLDCNQAI